MALISSGKINLNPLLSDTFDFEDSIAGFDRAARQLPEDVKLQIRMR